LALNQRDRDRLKELHAVIRGRLRLSEAARHLGLSRRQTRRLVRRVEREGDRGVLHRLRGRTSNRAIPERVYERAVALLKQAAARSSSGLATGSALGLSRTTSYSAVVSGRWRR
jgi:transposase